ncbi:hypothetical protein [Burkholderia sp. MSMB1078WGS]|uniref:hypothetical protein n=1 Tax=Burkholderia sp. MSMB1078WGS TaxID=1637900 RepID=UPI0012E358AF|nr:hypothetical protein [Burkholderia sp. MSMB1078WGS]
MRQIKVMRKGAANDVIPDESGQLIGEEASAKGAEKRMKSSGKRMKKTAAGRAAVFDEAL